jgi:hypothetical protein
MLKDEGDGLPEPFDGGACHGPVLLVSQRPEDGGPTIQLPAAGIPLHPSLPEFGFSICVKTSG